MRKTVRTLSWPTSRIGEALEALARRSGLRPISVHGLEAPAWLPGASQDALRDWMDDAASSLAIEAVPTHCQYGELKKFLNVVAPAILRLELGEKPSFLLILRRTWRGLEVLCPDLTTTILPVRAVQEAISAPVETPLVPEIDRLVTNAGVTGSGHARLRSVMLAERLNSVPIDAGWIVRHRPSRAMIDQCREAGILPRLFGFVTAHTADYLLGIISWWVIGRGALEGRLDHGWLLGWVLLLITRIPLKLVGMWWQAVIAMRAAAVLKRRLLAGALRLEPEQVRGEGAGQLLGRVIESEALESLALNGALTGVVSLIEIVIAGGVLFFAANSLLLCGVLFAWIFILGCLTWRYTWRRNGWTQKRLEITNDLVERMAGHRTRLAQELPGTWHISEDDALEKYLHVSRQLDWSLVPLGAVVPRGWIITALVCIAYTFISGTATSTVLAIAFGGVLLADGALRRLTASLTHISGAAIAWQQVRPLYNAGWHEEAGGERDLVGQRSTRGDLKAALDARDVSHTHSGRSEKTLNRCNLRILDGERILIDGPSGGGKSTLASLLAGLRKPEGGSITLSGLDYNTLGSRAWRRSVAAAPQYHENHIFSNTLAFNLLMGRRWPPQPEDFEEAEVVCRDLGLGDLLERMPAGLLQTVGETGWQLSSGERSRIFVARALLQRSPILLLDESFGSLDPDSLQIAVNCVRRRASTLVIIAHP